MAKNNRPTIVITGASSGIGRALALELARHGWALGLTARRTPLLEQLREEIHTTINRELKVELLALDVCQTAGVDAALQDLVSAISAWRLWPVCERDPMQGAYQHALGRVALLGDAAHPMRPYLAQGAGMAIEDAAALGHVLQLAHDRAFDIPTLLQRYALRRWQRNARVQARATRNGEIFHAQGVVRWGRDAAMKLRGEKLLDMPWLYGGGENL